MQATGRPIKINNNRDSGDLKLWRLEKREFWLKKLSFVVNG